MPSASNTVFDQTEAHAPGRSSRSAARYTLVAIVIHWLSALAILALIVLGFVMTKLPLTPLHQFQLYQLHKSIGISVLLLSVLRIVWRVFHRPPPLLATMPRIERHAADAAHLALYGLLIGMPLTGWALVSASRFNIPTVLFGIMPWPHLPILSTMSGKAAAEAALKLVHAYGAWILIALLLVHIGAALRHHFALRDDTLRRMLPFLSR